MIRGTTPIHVFGVPFRAAEISALQVIYAQGGKPVLTRARSNCTLADGEITLMLTEQETLRFAEGTPVQLQLRVKTAEGRVYASRVMTLPLETCLSEGAIV